MKALCSNYFCSTKGAVIDINPDDTHCSRCGKRFSDEELEKFRNTHEARQRWDRASTEYILRRFFVFTFTTFFAGYAAVLHFIPLAERFSSTIPMVLIGLWGVSLLLMFFWLNRRAKKKFPEPPPLKIDQ
ncbi:MAG: hypothetical protein Q8Q39_04575 [bacterium]|nr:hypothetical protein [bacterium]